MAGNNTLYAIGFQYYRKHIRYVTLYEALTGKCIEISASETRELLRQGRIKNLEYKNGDFVGISGSLSRYPYRDSKGKLNNGDAYIVIEQNDRGYILVDRFGHEMLIKQDDYKTLERLKIANGKIVRRGNKVTLSHIGHIPSEEEKQKKITGNISNRLYNFPRMQINSLKSQSTVMSANIQDIGPKFMCTRGRVNTSLARTIGLKNITSETIVNDCCIHHISGISNKPVDETYNEVLIAYGYNLMDLNYNIIKDSQQVWDLDGLITKDRKVEQSYHWMGITEVKLDRANYFAVQSNDFDARNKILLLSDILYIGDGFISIRETDTDGVKFIQSDKNDSILIGLGLSGLVIIWCYSPDNIDKLICGTKRDRYINCTINTGKMNCKVIPYSLLKTKDSLWNTLGSSGYDLIGKCLKTKVQLDAILNAAIVCRNTVEYIIPGQARVNKIIYNGIIGRQQWHESDAVTYINSLDVTSSNINSISDSWVANKNSAILRSELFAAIKPNMTACSSLPSNGITQYAVYDIGKLKYNNDCIEFVTKHATLKVRHIAYAILVYSNYDRRFKEIKSEWISKIDIDEVLNRSVWADTYTPGKLTIYITDASITFDVEKLYQLYIKDLEYYDRMSKVSQGIQGKFRMLGTNIHLNNLGYIIDIEGHNVRIEQEPSIKGIEINDGKFNYASGVIVKYPFDIKDNRNKKSKFYVPYTIPTLYYRCNLAEQMLNTPLLHNTADFNYGLDAKGANSEELLEGLSAVHIMESGVKLGETDGRYTMPSIAEAFKLIPDTFIEWAHSNTIKVEILNLDKLDKEVKLNAIKMLLESLNGLRDTKNRYPRASATLASMMMDTIALEDEQLQHLMRYIYSKYHIKEYVF